MNKIIFLIIFVLIISFLYFGFGSREEHYYLYSLVFRSNNNISDLEIFLPIPAQNNKIADVIKAPDKVVSPDRKYPWVYNYSIKDTIYGKMIHLYIEKIPAEKSFVLKFYDYIDSKIEVNRWLEEQPRLNPVKNFTEVNFNQVKFNVPILASYTPNNVTLRIYLDYSGNNNYIQKFFFVSYVKHGEISHYFQKIDAEINNTINKTRWVHGKGGFAGKWK